MRARYLILPLLALIVVVGVQLSNSGAGRSTPTSPVLSAGDTADLLPQTDISSLGTVDTSDIDRRIEFWRARADVHAQSENEWIVLGDLFDLKGRMTGDVAQYVAAQQAYQTAIGIAAHSSAAHSGSARVMATLHDFNGALSESTTVYQLDPNALGALGVMFDSSVELGHLEQAQSALAILQARSDSPAIPTREARLDFLRGDTASAARLAESATSEAADSGDLASSLAFYNYTAAEYELLAGNLDAAQSDYQSALALLPGYPIAIYGEGRIAYARGDMTTAIADLKAATAALPRPDMLAFLGDLYALSGDGADASEQYATVDFIAGMTTTSGAGHVYDREYGLFLSDHGRNVAHALDLAQNEIAIRQDIYGYDALAWALHANGRDAEALNASNTALSLGTVDPKLLLHAGLIELANGLTTQGQAHLQQALALNPTISPALVAAARTALAQ